MEFFCCDDREAFGKVEAHLVHTLIKQGHLCPSLHTRIVPGSDELLYMHDAEFVCLGGNAQGYNYTIDGTVIANPGHFSRFSSFLSVMPDSLEVQMCAIDN